jgi:hypothetical protein
METQQSPETKSIKERKRSRLYPRYGLEDIVDFTSELNKLGGNVSIEAFAGNRGQSKSNSSFTGRISGAKQFGLLGVESNKLFLTPLALRILVPKEENDKTLALLEAFTKPELYKELIKSFNGKVLPERISLGNILRHDYGIEMAARDLAAVNFIHSAEYVSAIQNGILVVDTNLLLPTDETDIENKEQIIHKPLNQNPIVNQPKPSLTDNSTHQFTYAGGIKLLIPKTITNADDGIADGELKTVRDWASEFAKKYSASQAIEN